MYHNLGTLSRVNLVLRVSVAQALGLTGSDSLIDSKGGLFLFLSLYLQSPSNLLRLYIDRFNLLPKQQGSKYSSLLLLILQQAQTHLQ